MENTFNFYGKSDLAIEATEIFGDSSHLPTGVTVEESFDEKKNITITLVTVETEAAAEKIGKPIGRYITVESPLMDEPSENYHKEITEILKMQLEKLIPNLNEKKLLVAGIGNREITPDALGPLVAEHLFVTRHLFIGNNSHSELTKGLGNVSAIAPGVMAQTGMEGQEIILGIIGETKPDVLIVIDALAARNAQRLNRTVQLTDTGIRPGAGVGNYRHQLTKDTLGIPVIAIGVPTVIDAAAIVSDTMDRLLYALSDDPVMEKIDKATSIFNGDEKMMLMRELMEPMMCNMFVTPKDIDESVGRISYTISEAINGLCHSV